MYSTSPIAFPSSISLARNWWSLVLRGVAAVAFGILTFAVPGITLRLLLVAFAAYAIVEGLLTIIGAERGVADAGRGRWVTLLLEGLLSIVAGVVALVAPGLTAVFLVYLIAAWAGVTGLLRLISAVRLREHVAHEWMLVLGGLLSLAFAGLILWQPALGALAMIFQIGAYAIVLGVTFLVLGFRLRGWSKAHEGEDRPHGSGDATTWRTI